MPFDATLKDLGRDYPNDLLTTFDQPPTGTVSLLNVDLSTITAAADLVLGIGEPLHEVVHVDFQSSASAWKHADILTYNALLHAEYHVPVHSIVILLRSKAAHANLSGTVSYTTRSGRGSMNFAYELVRLWERPADAFLKGGLGTLPFAVLGALPADMPTEDALAGVARQVIGRLEQEAAPEQSRKLLTMAFVLIGLRVNRNVALEVFRGVRQMKDSDTYMAILEEGLEKGLERGLEKGREEGREEELRQLILMLAEEYFGPVEESVLARINAMSDLNLLRRIVRRIPKEPSLEALLETS